MLDGEDEFGGRRLVQCTAAERAAIVAESYEDGATAAGVAAHHGIQPSQLSTSMVRSILPKAALVMFRDERVHVS